MSVSRKSSSRHSKLDESFILHGRKTPIRALERKVNSLTHELDQTCLPEQSMHTENTRKSPAEIPDMFRMKSSERTYLTNSEKTLTSHNLSQTSLNRPESRTNSLRYTDATNWDEINVLFDSANGSIRHDNFSSSKRNKKKSEKGEFSLDFKSLNSSLNKSLNKSVSFNNYLPKKDESSSDEESLEDTFEEELQRLIDRDAQEVKDQKTTPNLVGMPHDSNSSQWFTHPVHLTKSSDFPVFESLGVEVQKTSPKNRTVGMLGMELAQHKVSSEILLDEAAREYFPVTLGAMPSLAKTVTPPLPYTRSASFSSRRPMSAKSEPRNTSYATKTRPQSAKTRTQAMDDHNYLQASQPFVDQSVIASPHQHELARLRMERLRLEEERILEGKRQEELERIRGPKPKWYEMKTPHFTYEHYKHNQLLKSQDRWQELMDYRNNLTTSSKEFSKGHSS